MKVERLKTFNIDESNTVKYGEPQAITAEDGFRRYQIDDKNAYPSITTVLGYFKRKSIMEWRARVGAEEANKISAKASRRGTTIHDMVEQYLKNEDMDKIIEKRNPVDVQMFKQLLPTLSRIDNIFLQERALFSDTLKIAGRVDLGAEFDGIRSIIDFKTSTREKDEEYIRDYFEQATAYALMYEYLTGIGLQQIVIIIANDESPEPQVFVRDPDMYIQSLLLRIDEFRKVTG